MISSTVVIPPASLGEPFYRGSVQRLFAVPGEEGLMVTQTTARGSVFDVGALFEIPGSDVNRAVFRHVLYSRLEQADCWDRVAEAIESDSGLPEADREALLSGPLERCRRQGARTHHEGMIDATSGEIVHGRLPDVPSSYNVVRRYQILKPVRCAFLGAHLFDYARFPHEDGYVVPLEYIVRFGITSGSSVYRKYRAMGAAEQKVFERELGASRPLEAWRMLERPITDFTTKFEPEDRMVSKQEALVMSGLTGPAFADSGMLGVLGAWVVRHLLEGIGLQLWDIKWEFAKDGDDLVFVDTIDTDSFRATGFLEVEGGRYVFHVNKQSMRDYFRILHGDWIDAIQISKQQARESGAVFTDLLAEGQREGRYPQTPEVEASFIAIQVRKMDLIRDHLLEARPAETIREGLLAAGQEEFDFYRKAGKLEAFAELNRIA